MLADLSSIKSFGDIKFLYFKYKDSVWATILVVVLILLVGIIVLIKVVMPQIDNWFSIQHEVSDTKDRIALLQTNQATLASIDETTVDNQYDLASQALPYDKNYTGFVTAIDTATLVSGMLRDDYSFSVGDLSTKSAQLAPDTGISVKITVEGDANQLLTFLQTMQKQLPLAEIVSISFRTGHTNIEMNFFYKYKQDNLQIPYTDPIRTLTDKNKQQLQTLDQWAKAEATVAPQLNTTDVPIATPSGDLP